MKIIGFHRVKVYNILEIITSLTPKFQPFNCYLSVRLGKFIISSTFFCWHITKSETIHTPYTTLIKVKQEGNLIFYIELFIWQFSMKCDSSLRRHIKCKQPLSTKSYFIFSFPYNTCIVQSSNHNIPGPR